MKRTVLTFLLAFFACFTTFAQESETFGLEKPTAGFAGYTTDSTDVLKMEFCDEPATIRFKALNYNKGMNAEIWIWYFDCKNATHKNEKVFFDDNGCAELTINNYLPTWVQSTISFHPSGLEKGFSDATAYLVPGKEITLLVDMTKHDEATGDNIVGREGYLANVGVGMSMFEGLATETPEFPYDEFYKANTVQQIAGLHDMYMQRVKAWFESRKAEGGHPEDLRYNASYKEMRFFETVAEYHPDLFISEEFRDYILTSRPECFYGDYFDLGQNKIYSLFAGTDVEGLGPDIWRYLYAVNETQYGHFVKKPVIHNPDLSRMYDEVTVEAKAKVQELRRSKPAKIHFFDEIADIPPTEFLQTIADRYKGKTVLFRLDLGVDFEEWEETKVSDFTTDSKNVVIVNLFTSVSSLDEWLMNVKGFPGEQYVISPLQSSGIFYELGDRLHGYPIFAVYKDGKRIFGGRR